MIDDVFKAILIHVFCLIYLPCIIFSPLFGRWLKTPYVCSIQFLTHSWHEGLDKNMVVLSGNYLKCTFLV